MLRGEVEYLVSGSSGAFATGPVEWNLVGGSHMAELMVFTNEELPSGSSVLLARIPVAAPERMHAVLKFRDEAARRACWNSSHREGGVLGGLPVHGHSLVGARRSTYIDAPGLSVIPDVPQPEPHYYREAFWSFAAWCTVDLATVTWTDPPVEGGE